jgi:hypothetical protein
VGEKITEPHVLAFAERYLLDLSIDPNLYRHGVGSLHGAEAHAINREIFGFHNGGGDGEGRWAFPADPLV